MSVKIMTLVFEYDMPDIRTDDGKNVPDSTAKFVLLAYADHANDDGEAAYPSLTRLCRKVSMSRGTVERTINALRNNDFIIPVGVSKRNTNNYTINVEKLKLSSNKEPVLVPNQFHDRTDRQSYDRTDTSSTVEPESSSNHPFNHPTMPEKIQEKPDLLDGILKFSKTYEPINDYPEMYKPYLEIIRDKFGLEIPRKNERGHKSWEGELYNLRKQCIEYDGKVTGASLFELVANDYHGQYAPASPRGIERAVIAKKAQLKMGIGNGNSALDNMKIDNLVTQ